jgi:SAM-dependent methyltransferase
LNSVRDPRAGSALYYDLGWPEFDDLGFYSERVRRFSASSVLELGCGTGRVLLPLSRECRRYVGVEISEEYVEATRRKLADAGLGAPQVQVLPGDITRLELGERFDLVIAPWRVFQALASDEEVAGFFETLRRHLAPGGHGILNAFRPNRDRAKILEDWGSPGETEKWRKCLDDGTVVLYTETRPPIDRDPLVLRPKLIWRRYRLNPDGSLGERIDEVIMPIRMRCWYPDEFVSVIERNGFEIVERFGGYAGEGYEQGTELVVSFKASVD